MIKDFSKKEIKLQDNLLYVKVDTKRLKVVEYCKGKKRVLLNKEREVRKTNKGGMAKKKYRRHYGSLIKNTRKWHLSNFSKIILKDKYDKIKIEARKDYAEYFNQILKRKNLNREWYEKFRWFKFKDTLVIGGKSEESNEELLKRFKQDSDIVLHTEAPGSPFYLIKGDKDALKKAAIETAYYSQDWKRHKNDVKVMYCKGDQIRKEKSMKVGSFNVKGKRNIIIVKKEEIKKRKNV